MENTSSLCPGRRIADAFRYYGAHALVAPAIGGAGLAERVTRHLKELTERTTPVICLDKTFTLAAEDRARISGAFVLIIQDELGTGDTTGIVNATRNANAHILGIGAIGNRGSIMFSQVHALKQAGRIFTITSDPLESVQQAACAICAPAV